MSQQHAEAWPPTPKQLAAYVDGELDAPEHRHVAQWLASHPEAAAEVEAQRRLLSLCRQLPPRQPTEEEWAVALSRIEAASVTPTRARVGQRLALLGAALTGLAATVGLVLLGGLPRHAGTVPQLRSGVVPGVEVWPVATAFEVEIISMDAADATFLVIGEPPVNEPLVLAGPGEIKLDRMEPDEDGIVPYFADAQWPDAPMIVVPAPLGGSRDP